MHRVHQLKLARQVFENRPVVPVTENPQLSARHFSSQDAKGPQQYIDTLLTRQPTDRHEVGATSLIEIAPIVGIA
jgi:hypothetical protein